MWCFLLLSMLNIELCHSTHHVPVLFVVGHSFVLDVAGKAFVKPQVVPPGESHCGHERRWYAFSLNRASFWSCLYDDYEAEYTILCSYGSRNVLQLQQNKIITYSIYYALLQLLIISEELRSHVIKLQSCPRGNYVDPLV